VSRKTIRRVLHGAPPRPKRHRPSKLDPYRAKARYLVENEDWPVIDILDELRALGYDGGYTILKEYVRSIRPKPARRPVLRFETEPGKQGQADLSPYNVRLGQGVETLVCFAVVLGFSRWRFYRFVRHADVHTLMLCHRLAFEDAGGVPAEILYDQMKQVVIRFPDGETLIQADFSRLVQHYGFRPTVLEPGYKEGKGKVENLFLGVESYVTKRPFHDLDDLNRKIDQWRHTKWHRRPHRTTGEPPAHRLVVEQSHLLTLPDTPFRCEQRQRCLIGKDFTVEHEGAFYSVWPDYAGKWGTRCTLDGRLWVEVEGQVVGEHLISDERYKRFVLPEHEAAFRQANPRKEGIRRSFLALGPVAERYAEGLDRDQGGASTYHMSKILRLIKRVGPARVVDAMRWAQAYDTYRHTAVARIVRARTARRQSVDTATRILDRPPGNDSSPQSAPARMPPNVEAYLRAGGGLRRQRSLDQYRNLIDSKARAHASNKDEEDPDGQ